VESRDRLPLWKEQLIEDVVHHDLATGKILRRSVTFVSDNSTFGYREMRDVSIVQPVFVDAAQVAEKLHRSGSSDGQDDIRIQPAILHEAM